VSLQNIDAFIIIDIPQPYIHVFTSTGKGTILRMKGDRLYFITVAPQRLNTFPICDIPQPKGLIFTAAGESGASVRTEGD
jgi:hypothetical protein